MGCAQGKCCLPRDGSGCAGEPRGGVPAGRGDTTLGRAAVPRVDLLLLEYATLTVDGLYPESQDAYLVATRFAGDRDLHLFAVLDSHDASGTAYAGFARDALPRLFLASAASDGGLAADPADRKSTRLNSSHPV